VFEIYNSEVKANRLKEEIATDDLHLTAFVVQM
jgi:hypothetical protein